MHSDKEEDEESKIEEKEEEKADKVVDEVEVGRSSPKIIGKGEEGYDSDEAWF